MTAKQPEFQSFQELKEKYPFSKNKLVWFLVPFVLLLEWFFNSAKKASKEKTELNEISVPSGIATYEDFRYYHPLGSYEDFIQYQKTGSY